ncbi:ABC transporter substrate-binding protein [Celeribacter indicus]|uniref:Extracellular solute-binding protein n=1 Tax=Celeribacter indicus TaxID=1208324 RepID=A0A0B5DX21_9RHOB|nr:ABC transporter substrate-binding protein [Celeribacter indicus]AJE47569.1 extracellular solute-binding protein [Celeribacter indicus]SDW10499.1 peptide/nickel transport system substrate-binding protein [Celeribacter indicus]
MDRRNFLRYGMMAGAAMAAPRLNPDFFFSSAYAQDMRPLTFLSAENITGNWDPTAHTTLSQTNIEGFVMGFLTRAPMRPDNPDEVVYELATEINEIDAHTLEIKLRDDVTFHDGKPFTAADVKATFEYGAQPDRPKQVYPGPTETFEVTTPDNYTVIVDTSKGGYGASLFIFLASYLPMLSATDIADGPGGMLSQRLNGTGPFKFVAQRGNDTVMEAFPEYFRGAPKIPGVTFSFVGDATTRMLSLMNGQADVIERLEPEQVETLEGEENIKLSRLVSVENKYLWFRCSKPPFDNPLLRKAAAHAIDRSVIMEIMGSAGEASSNFISPIKFGYTDLDNYPEYDPEECQRLLAEAGYPGGEGLPELEYITSTGFYPKTKEYGEVITALLQEQGFPVTLNVMEVAAWNERLYDRPGGGPGHMVDCGWSTGSPEPDLVLRTHFHSTSKRICGIEDPEIDAALDEERNASSLEARKESLQTNLMPMLAEKVPALSLFTSVLIHGMRADVENLFIYPDGMSDASQTVMG